MGLSVQSLPKKVLLLLSYIQYTIKNFNMVDNVETTTPTVEEVAANGESKTATEEVKEAVASENGTNGVHKEEEKKEENGEAKEAEATPETTTSEAEAVAEETKEESAEEATKRKADEPSEDETSEKIAKLKETAADVVPRKRRNFQRNLSPKPRPQ